MSKKKTVNEYLPFPSKEIEDLIKPFIKTYKKLNGYRQIDSVLIDEVFPDNKLIEFFCNRGPESFTIEIVGYHHTLPEDWDESIQIDLDNGDWKYEDDIRYSMGFYLNIEDTPNDSGGLTVQETTDLFLYEIGVFWKKLNKMWGESV
jgi:hypothetical protein